MKRQCDEKRYVYNVAYYDFSGAVGMSLRLQFSFQRTVRIHAKCAEGKGKI
jgi:hypothetical protein